MSAKGVIIKRDLLDVRISHIVLILLFACAQKHNSVDFYLAPETVDSLSMRVLLFNRDSGNCNLFVRRRRPPGWKYFNNMVKELYNFDSTEYYRNNKTRLSSDGRYLVRTYVKQLGDMGFSFPGIEDSAVVIAREFLDKPLLLPEILRDVHFKEAGEIVSKQASEVKELLMRDENRSIISVFQLPRKTIIDGKRILMLNTYKLSAFSMGNRASKCSFSIEIDEAGRILPEGIHQVYEESAGEYLY